MGKFFKTDGVKHDRPGDLGAGDSMPLLDFGYYYKNVWRGCSKAELCII